MGSTPEKWLQQAGLTPILSSYAVPPVAKNLQTSQRMPDKHLKAKSPWEAGEGAKEVKVSTQKELQKAFAGC